MNVLEDESYISAPSLKEQYDFAQGNNKIMTIKLYILHIQCFSKKTFLSHT